MSNFYLLPNLYLFASNISGRHLFVASHLMSASTCQLAGNKKELTSTGWLSHWLSNTLNRLRVTKSLPSTIFDVFVPVPLSVVLLQNNKQAQQAMMRSDFFMGLFLRCKSLLNKTFADICPIVQGFQSSE